MTLKLLSNLACSVDGLAQFLVTQDSDLRSLGENYEGVYIVTWNGLEVELLKQSLTDDCGGNCVGLELKQAVLGAYRRKVK